MKKRGLRKKRVGIVLSNKMDKTTVVQAVRLVKHRLYKKYIRRRVKYVCHDELNQCQIGDKVAIIETRPLSKMKRWRVSKIVEKAV
ncbi:MAG: 30S ribosomal protein S17 [Deltaproteobacteria bacterium]|nr:30S ribosomal protein S17 [Deltaproteobacteria bacterium]